MDFYYLNASSSCRSVMMLAKALNLQLNMKVTDLRTGDHLTPEFIKLNPQHTIPTLVDNGFSVWESRAILIYLAEKYGKDDSLYPKCPNKRAVVNQRLFFDMGTLYGSLFKYIYPIFYQNAPADPEQLKKVEEALGFLNTFLEGNKYVAGDTMTVADFAILATVSKMDVVGISLTTFSNVSRWYENAKKITPGWKENWQGCLELKSYFDKK